MNIKANNLSVMINGKTILSNVTLEAEGGKMTALTGASGSGKTTLLNCLGLIQPISSGEIMIDGISAADWNERKKVEFWKKNATFIYQDYGIIDEETVAYNVLLQKVKLNGSRVKEVLKTVGLSGRENDLAIVLSGGEKQRLGIARAMLKNASVIFADEPTASLDSGNREMVISLLKQCAQNGSMVILATHDERLVKECDCVITLSHS